LVALPAPERPLTDGVVTLRRFTFDDVPAVSRACQDPEIPRWTAGIPQPYDEEDARSWIGRHDDFWAEEQMAAFAFCDAGDGELLGSMSLAEVDFTSRSANVGYWAAPWARRRGATTRALRLICGWGFEALGLDVVHLMTLPGNVASERVAEKAGFAAVGMLDDVRLRRALDPEARHRLRHWVLRRGGAEEPADKRF
jgi:RimJ/RimL family protein N-acetyltransferase